MKEGKGRLSRQRRKDLKIAAAISTDVHGRCIKQGFLEEEAEIWSRVFLRAFSRPVTEMHEEEVS